MTERKLEPSEKPRWNTCRGARDQLFNGAEKRHGVKHPWAQSGLPDDELAKQWGAWGGDRKLSPRFRPLPDKQQRRDIAINSAIIGGITLLVFAAVLWEMVFA